MKRSSRLRPIAHLAAHREQQATQQMAESEARLAAQEELLRELEQYHADYASGDNLSRLAGSDAIRLQDFRIFLDRLEHAMARQRQVIAELRAAVATDRRTWTDRRSQRKALDNATDRFTRAETRASDIREQLDVDEISALLRARPNADTDS